MTRQPATRAHNDYTERSAPRRVRDLMGDGVDMLLGTRYEFTNVWWPARSAMHGRYRPTMWLHLA